MNFGIDKPYEQKGYKKKVERPKKQLGTFSDKHWLKDEFYERFKLYNPDNRMQHEIPSNYLRVSEFTGGCRRKAFYRLTNAPEVEISDVQSKLRMDIGTKLHEMIQDTMGDYLTDVETRFYDHERKITGQIDGFIPSKKTMMDIKTAGLSSFVLNQIRNKATKSHIAQLHWYSHMYEKTTGIKPEGGLIFYMNRNVDIYFNNYPHFTYTGHVQSKKDWLEDGFVEDVKICEVKITDEIMQQQFDELEDFWNRVDKKKPPPKTTKRWMCDTCPYKQTCFKKK